MKSRETLIRLKKFQVDEKRRKVVQIEGMIAEFDRMAAITRRDNLKRSADELKGQLEDARAALAEAFEELKKIELLDERDQVRERAVENAREQAELDRIGALRARDGIGI
jgi:flagellar FliJ protein